MARYIEANDLVRAMTLQANRTMLGKIAPPQLSYSEMLEIIADATTADVVPRSEVERLQGALKAEELHNELTMEMAQKALQNAKVDVAREIFEEIEKLVHTLRYDADYSVFDLQSDIAELKKKYTEK